MRQLVLVLCAVLATFTADAAPSFKLELAIAIGDEAPQESSMLLEAGKPASLTLADESGNGRRVEATVTSTNTRDGKAGANIDLTIAELQEGQANVVATPAFTAELGKRASLRMDDASGAPQLQVAVLVTKQ